MVQHFGKYTWEELDKIDATPVFIHHIWRLA